MKLFIRTRTRAKEEGVVKVDDSHFVISVKEPPIEGKANEAIINLLSKYFQVTKAKIKIIKGLKGKNKVVEIGGNK